MTTCCNTVYQRNRHGIMNEIPVRFITNNMAFYIRKEDVVDLIEQMVVAEKTDVRNRFTRLVQNIKKIGT